MEIPTEVLVHNQILGLKGGRAVLVRVAQEGFYEVNLIFGERTHRTLLPIHSTVLIQKEAEPPEIASEFEIER